MFVLNLNLRVLAGVLLFSMSAFGQTEIIVLEEPLESQYLSGVVQVGDAPEGAKGVLVELCSTEWKSVKASKRTDKNGRFKFRNPARDDIQYLRLSFPGAHTLQVKVRITKVGPKKLALRLDFST